MPVETIDLKIAVDRPTAWGRELTITVPADRVDRARADAASKLAQKVRLPGFRKGKVPATVLEKRYGAAIEQETLEHVIGDAYREAVKRENLHPITQGSVSKVDYQKGQDLTFQVALEVRPEIELARVGGFRLVRNIQPVLPDQVEAVVQRLREQQAVWHPLTDESLADGDMVHVEITARSGEAMGKPRAYQLVLGEKQAVPAIEVVIRSLQPGQEGDFTVNLPEKPDDPSSEEKPHDIHLKMIEAKRPEVPALDDDFARSVGDFASLSDLQARVRSDLEQEAGREAEREVRSRLLQQIVEANPFDVPDSMVQDYAARLVPQNEGDDPQRVAEVRQAATPAAADALRRMLVVERVAEMESLHATPDEVEARVNEIAEKLGRAPADVRARFGKSGRMDEIENDITEQKVFDYLLTLSTIE